jgi:GTPase SAR1 family protein
MSIAALYLADHAYLAHDFNLIDLGGRYQYTLLPSKTGFRLSRRPNPQYLEGFFDISDSRVPLENVSAIVGQNGVGKSTLLDVIRRHFIENEYALPSVRSFLLLEAGDGLAYYSREELDITLTGGQQTIRAERVPAESIRSIYYSPHFDLRYNPNFDDVDYFDISLDKYLELDLEDLGKRGTNEHGVDYPVKQELLFKNSVRQIFFLTSDLVVTKGVFKELFDFPVHGQATLTFRETKIDEQPRNVPRVFLSPLDKLREKIKTELDNWTQVRQPDKKRKDSQLDADRYLLKRYMIEQLLSVILRQMDISNSYLSAADFDIAVFEAAQEQDAFGWFLAFLDACRIHTTKGAVPPFDTALIRALFEKLYAVADQVTDGRYLKAHELTVPPADAITILQLQKAVVFDISAYYSKQIRESDKDSNRFNYFVPGFIFYAPADRKLSSGENALLNLFSRLYDFLENKLSPRLNPKAEIRTFLLLLDEADSGFHPVWKKKFVNALVRTLPYFFEPYRQKPSLQIIFTTHDPLTLSDLPNANVVCLVNEEGKVRALDQTKSLATFGANITDLLADSFFIEDGLIGNFARHKIQETVKWLNGASKDEAAYHKKFIAMIDEPIVRRKLAEMYDEKMQGNFELEVIDRQIEELQQLRKKLDK